jgi:hypothetical protein
MKYPGQGQAEPLTGPEPAPPLSTRNRTLRLVRLIGGWLLLILGIIGCFLPILQGFLMMAAGLAILSRESPFIRRQVRRLAPYYRLARRRYHAWEEARRVKKGGRSRPPGIS